MLLVLGTLPICVNTQSRVNTYIPLKIKLIVDTTSSTPNFQPSTIFSARQEIIDTTVRHSDKAPLPRDHTAKCIEDRARRFQGWKPFVFIEKLWAQRYATGGHYTYHYDWTIGSKNSGRVSSFMVYLSANCTGGGTHFPRLQKPAGEEWCKFIECNGEYEDEGLKAGVIFKPVKGNAVYWENMRADGSGYAESWHAGLPVTGGEKIGLNIWSWLQVGYKPEDPE
jgi:prolyl 4-hydroxylase